MIIDLILDRECDDQDIAAGYTHRQYPDGKLVELKYNPRKFYHKVMGYIDGAGDVYADKITYAMDYGTEENVKSALCEYVINNEYNPEICDYINSVQWLS